MRFRTRRGQLLWAVALIVAVVVTWLAAWAILRVPDADSAAGTIPSYTVTEGEAGYSVTADATVTFDLGRVATAANAGVVTSIDAAAGDVVEAGDTLASVGMRPVVVMQGEVPAYRDLAAEARGSDVAQLRAFFGLTAGDRFDWELSVRVREWQTSHGITPDGVVRLGDVVFVPELPARGAPAEGVRVGAPVAQGDELYVMTASTATLTLDIDRLPRVAVGQPVTAHLPGGVDLAGTIGEPTHDASGARQYPIVDAGGATVCGADCAALFAPGQNSTVPVTIEVIPEQRGLVVPNAAIGSGADGATVVRTVQGEAITVTVIVQGDGVSVVEGVEAGTEIRLFGDTP